MRNILLYAIVLVLWCVRVQVDGLRIRIYTHIALFYIVCFAYYTFLFSKCGNSQAISYKNDIGFILAIVLYLIYCNMKLLLIKCEIFLCVVSCRRMYGLDAYNVPMVVHIWCLDGYFLQAYNRNFLIPTQRSVETFNIIITDEEQKDLCVLFIKTIPKIDHIKNISITYI